MLGRMVNMFGGKAAREGVTSTIAVKGDRKATLNDADRTDRRPRRREGLRPRPEEEDLQGHDLRRAAAPDGRGEEEGGGRRAQGSSQEEKAKPASATRTRKQVEVDFDVKNTGEKKAINGFDTHQVIMTITLREKGKTLEQSGGLVMTSDMWLAPKIAAMKEIADFDLRYAQKLYGPMVAGVSAEQMAAAMAMYPMMKDAMAKMSAEGGKIDGTRDPDDGDDGRGEVGRADGAGSEGRTPKRDTPTSRPAAASAASPRRHAREEDRTEERRRRASRAARS